MVRVLTRGDIVAGAKAARAETGSLLPALAIAGFALAAGSVAYMAPPATGEMAVVFLPGTGEKTVHAAILAAGGSFVAPTRLDNIAVAYAHDPDFAGRVSAFGGLFTLAARGLCTPQKGPAT